MKRSIAATLASLLILAACQARTERPSSNEAEGRGGQSTERRSDTLKRSTDIYSATIRTLMRQSRGFERIYVVDGPVKGAGNMHVRAAARPFPKRLKNALIRKLDDLQPLGFISHPDEVREGEAGVVANDGVIVLLGEIERHGARVHVGYTSWCGGLCAQSETYVLRPKRGSWAVVGNTGQMIIS
jgi:hypothetical protein